MDRLLEYISHHPWYAAGAAIAAALVIAYELRARNESFAAVSPQDVIRLMNHGALLIDLRPPDAYANGHVAGARQMNGEQILKAGDTLRKHKEKAVIVYDDTGSLGASAARQLAAQGFTKAFNLRGGIAAWRAENLPLSKA
ncbi:MAG: rhodanese-like domain-containing protein [Steroidobacteraceae bacterium]